MGVYNERLNSKQRDLNVCHGLGCSSKNNSEDRSGCSGHTGVTGPGQTRKKRQDLYMRIGTMKDSKTKTEESTRLGYTGFRHSCCHTHLDTSVSQR